MPKLQKMNAAAKATLMFSLANIIHYGCSLLYAPVFARLMSQAEYGIVTIYNSWLGLLTPVLTLNVWGSAYIGFVEYKTERDQFAAAAQQLILPLCGFAALMLLIFPNELSAFLTLPLPLLWFMLLNVTTTPAFQFWNARQRYEGRYKALFWTSVANSVAVLVLGILAVWQFPEKKAEARIVGGGIVPLLLYSALFFLVLVRGRKGGKKREKRIFALKMSLAQLPGSIASSLLSQMDRIMIAQILGQGSAAVYGMAGTVNNAFYSIILSAINATWVPAIFHALENGQQQELKKNANYLTALVAIVCLLVILVAPEGILFLGGFSYEKAKWCVPGLILCVVFSFVSGLFGNVTAYYKRPQYQCVGPLAGVGVNLVLNYLLIPAYGITAASYTSLVASIVGCVISYRMMLIACKKCGAKYHLYDLFILTAIAIGTLILGIGCTMLYEYIVPRYITFLLAILAVLWKRKEILKLIQRK